jgi:hypothetical protein
MKSSLNFLFSLMLILVLSPIHSAFATGGIGGSSGGSGAKLPEGKWITVDMYVGDGPHGDRHEKRTILYRPPTAQEPAQCVIPSGQAGYKPCPTKFGVPKVLKDLNDFFDRDLDKAKTPPGQKDNMKEVFKDLEAP